MSSPYEPIVYSTTKEFNKILKSVIVEYTVGSLTERYIL
jgi:hypothetical protein